MPDATDLLRVLIVEDEIELGRNVRAWLEAQGMETCYAATLAEARRILDAEPCLDLVITDIYLEGEPSTEQRPGGFILAEECDARTPRLPVILLTGQPSMDAAVEGLRQHAFDFLTKPVSLPLLYKRALKAVEERRLRQRLTELEEVNDLLSRIVPNTIEAKDPSTRGHSDRVADYADTLGRRCGLTAGELRDLRLASMFHDVGKIGVPEAILTKPGKLTRDERAEIEKHPAIGQQILAPLQHLPQVRDWVYQHHERWDGRGYPEGLAGEEVALPGRILILAEVFDALATARSYKPAWSNEDIADYFENDKGGHFDPELSLVVAAGVREHGAGWFRSAAAPGAEEVAVRQMPLF